MAISSKLSIKVAQAIGITLCIALLSLPAYASTVTKDRAPNPQLNVNDTFYESVVLLEGSTPVASLVSDKTLAAMQASTIANSIGSEANRGQENDWYSSATTGNTTESMVAEDDPGSGFSSDESAGRFGAPADLDTVGGTAGVGSDPDDGDNGGGGNNGGSSSVFHRPQ